MTDWFKAENIYIDLSLLKMTYFGGKNFYLDRIELHSYILIANSIHYGQMRPAFVVKKDAFYLGIFIYRSSAGIYLSVRKSVLQTK